MRWPEFFLVISPSESESLFEHLNITRSRNNVISSLSALVSNQPIPERVFAEWPNLKLLLSFFRDSIESTSMHPRVIENLVS